MDKYTIQQLKNIERAMLAPRVCWDYDYEAERNELLDDLLDEKIEEALTDADSIDEAYGYATGDQWKEICALEAKMFGEMRRGFCEENLVGLHEIAEKKKEILTDIFRKNAKELLDWGY
jgi:hypothetical protein